jgi:hypothetical protein
MPRMPGHCLVKMTKAWAAKQQGNLKKFEEIPL